MGSPAYIYMPVPRTPLASRGERDVERGYPAMKWYFHACPVCGGDLHDDLEDHGWVTCFMCARSFKATDVRLDHADDSDARIGIDVEELPTAA